MADGFVGKDVGFEAHFDDGDGHHDVADGGAGEGAGHEVPCWGEFDEGAGGGLAESGATPGFDEAPFGDGFAEGVEGGKVEGGADASADRGGDSAAPEFGEGEGPD